MPTDRRRLVVVGASLAGLRAVEAARRKGFTGTITLIGAEEHLPYDRPPLSKAFLVEREPPEVTYRPHDELTGDLGVELRLGAPATAMDTACREVHVDDEVVPYDALVIATGSAARELPGTEGLPGVRTLRTVDDARAIRQTLDAGGRVVVIGAGFIGSEVASSARARGAQVTVLEAADVLLERAVGARMGAALAALHERHGSDLRCGVAVEGIDRSGDGFRVGLSDNVHLDADLVVVGVGAAPQTSWLADSGLAVDDGVVADETLATGAPGVYAAGDVVRWPNELFGVPMRLEHWTSAAEQGALAAVNALGLAEPRPYSTVPYFWSDWYGSRIQFVGVPRADEVRVVGGDPEAGPFVALYRQGDRLTGALLVDRPSLTMKFRRLIGQRSTWEDALDFARERCRTDRPDTSHSPSGQTAAEALVGGR